MVKRLDTVEDVEKAFGLPPEATQDVAGERSRPAAGSARSEYRMPLSELASVARIEFGEIEVRPVRVADWLELGDFEEWQIADGKPLRIVDFAVLRSYLERVVSVPGEPSLKGGDILLALALPDALEVRRRVVGFFAPPPKAASETS